MPPPSETWKTFWDDISKDMLAAAANSVDYKACARRFHARLAIMIRRLSTDKLHDIFLHTMPHYVAEGLASHRQQAIQIFEAAHFFIETLIVDRVRAYATMWLENPAGAGYQEQYERAK